MTLRGKLILNSICVFKIIHNCYVRGLLRHRHPHTQNTPGLFTHYYVYTSNILTHLHIYTIHSVNHTLLFNSSHIDMNTQIVTILTDTYLYVVSIHDYSEGDIDVAHFDYLIDFRYDNYIVV